MLMVRNHLLIVTLRGIHLLMLEHLIALNLPLLLLLVDYLLRESTMASLLRLSRVKLRRLLLSLVVLQDNASRLKLRRHVHIDLLRRS